MTQKRYGMKKSLPAAGRQMSNIKLRKSKKRFLSVSDLIVVCYQNFDISGRSRCTL
jgi:hypothetical protein